MIQSVEFVNDGNLMKIERSEDDEGVVFSMGDRTYYAHAEECERIVTTINELMEEE
jgi:hypothetical protein